MWRLNNTVLNNTWVKEEISREVERIFELNKNESNQICGMRKSSAQRFLAFNAYIRKVDRSKINNLVFHPRKLRKKDDQIKSKE